MVMNKPDKLEEKIFYFTVRILMLYLSGAGQNPEGRKMVVVVVVVGY